MAIALPVVALVSISVIRLVPSSTKPVAVIIPVILELDAVICPTVTSGEPANPLAVPVSVPVTLPVRLPEKEVEVVTPVTIAPLLNVGALSVSYTHLTLPTKA